MTIIDELKKLKKHKYWFYRCVKCGKWHYSKKRIKRKKCLKCNQSFKFDHSKKFSKKCSRNEAIAIIKKLKEDESDKEYGFFELSLNKAGEGI